jgi:hypothetical protein
MAHQPRPAIIGQLIGMTAQEARNLGFHCLRQQRSRAVAQHIGKRSENAPGWDSLMRLTWVMAYHSFSGKVEASNTPTIRRLTPSRRHQLPRITPIALPKIAL